MPAPTIPFLNLAISDLARNSEQLISQGLNDPSPITVFVVFFSGLITSLVPFSISLFPITVAFLAGFQNQQGPFLRSLNFCGGIVLALVILGSISGFLGKIYGQVPSFVSTLVALLAVLMGLNLLGILKLPLPNGPDPTIWQQKVPMPLAPISAGFAFGLAASPCTTPVLAVLLAWIAKTESPGIGILLLSSFGFGQVLPLFLAGTAAASIPNLLALRPIGQWIPPLSGTIFLTTGLLTLLANWI